jgi:hypothetical protein
MLMIRCVGPWRERPWRRHVMWRLKVTKVKSATTPLATGVPRRPQTCWPPLQVHFKDPRADADPMGFERAPPDRPLDGALTGLEEFYHLNPSDHIPE